MCQEVEWEVGGECVVTFTCLGGLDTEEEALFSLDLRAQSLHQNLGLALFSQETGPTQTITHAKLKPSEVQVV